MAEIQTRRTLDLKPDLYRRFALYCEMRNVAMSSMLESILKPAIGMRGHQPAKRKPEQPAVRPRWVRGGLSYTRWDANKKGRAVEVAR